MTDLTRRLEQIFPDARTVTVLEQYLGFRRRDREFILLVEVEGTTEPGRHVVKLADADHLAAELAAWDSCRPPGLRHDPVLMTITPKHDGGGRLIGLLYDDAQQFLGDVRTVSLEHAFLDAVRHGSPTPDSVAEVFGQLYERLGYVLYSHSFLDDPNQADFVLALPHLERNLAVWQQPGCDPTRVRQDVNSWAAAERGHFRDPVDYLDFVCRNVPWLRDEPDGGPREVRRPRRQPGDPAAAELVPAMLRGCVHGDLHGRNVLVGLLRDRARWPAVFDYQHMGPANLLAWDFVKLETELKTRAYAALFAQEGARDFIKAVQGFEVRLAEQTEACHNGAPWPRGAAADDSVDRLLWLLLELRRQAAVHLGGDRGRPRRWLDEYYFALLAYGVRVGRFANLDRLLMIGAYVSAGVATARLLWGRDEQQWATLPEAPAAGGASGNVLRRLYPSFHPQLACARDWLREGGPRKEDALVLLKGLRQRYPHVLAVGGELVLALLEAGQFAEARADLAGLERQFLNLDEETRCRWGRYYKDAGDRAWREEDLDRAEQNYLEALRQYELGHGLRQGHYPGINRATLLLLLAALAWQRQDDRCHSFSQQADRAADELLSQRAQWSRELPDDHIWHPATAAEAYLLKRNWAEATEQYRVALAAEDVLPFHRASMGKQARRILDAWRRLAVPVGPEFDANALFGPEA
jgi:hypothetical protein